MDIALRRKSRSHSTHKTWLKRCSVNMSLKSDVPIKNIDAEFKYNWGVDNLFRFNVLKDGSSKIVTKVFSTGNQRTLTYGGKEFGNGNLSDLKINLIITTTDGKIKEISVPSDKIRYDQDICTRPRCTYH